MSIREQSIKASTQAYKVASDILDKIDGSKTLSEHEIMELDDALRTVLNALMYSNNMTGKDEMAELERAHFNLLESVLRLCGFLAGKGMSGSKAAVEKVKITDGKFPGISRNEAEWVVTNLRDSVYIVNTMPIPVGLNMNRS